MSYTDSIGVEIYNLQESIDAPARLENIEIPGLSEMLDIDPTLNLDAITPAEELAKDETETVNIEDLNLEGKGIDSNAKETSEHVNHDVQTSEYGSADSDDFDDIQILIDSGTF